MQNRLLTKLEALEKISATIKMVDANILAFDAYFTQIPANDYHSEVSRLNQYLLALQNEIIEHTPKLYDDLHTSFQKCFNYINYLGSASLTDPEVRIVCERDNFNQLMIKDYDNENPNETINPLQKLTEAFHVIQSTIDLELAQEKNHQDPLNAILDQNEKNEADEAADEEIKVAAEETKTTSNQSDPVTDETLPLLTPIKLKNKQHNQSNQLSIWMSLTNKFNANIKPIRNKINELRKPKLKFQDLPPEVLLIIAEFLLPNKANLTSKDFRSFLRLMQVNTTLKDTCNALQSAKFNSETTTTTGEIIDFLKKEKVPLEVLIKDRKDCIRTHESAMVKDSCKDCLYTTMYYGGFASTGIFGSTSVCGFVGCTANFISHPIPLPCCTETISLVLCGVPILPTIFCLYTAAYSTKGFHAARQSYKNHKQELELDRAAVAELENAYAKPVVMAMKRD